MKLKGITKLVLAGTALAATAATLTTSTYAWYVTNNEVKATNVQGSTAGAKVAGSLLISEIDTANAGVPKGYTTTITPTPTKTAARGTTDDGTALKPVNYVEYGLTKDTALDGNKTYYARTGSGTAQSPYVYAEVENPVVSDIATYYEKDLWFDAKGNLVTSPTYLEFKFWLKASEAMNGITVKTTVTNKAEAAVDDAKKQTAYISNGIPSAASVGGLFAVDAAYALRMQVIQETYTVTYADADNSIDAALADQTAVASKVVGVVENHKATNGNTDYASPAVAGFTAIDAGADANVYYMGIMKEAGFGTDATQSGKSPDAPSDTWTSINLTKDSDNLFTIRIWLEGTDAQCFDSCIGQDFQFDFEFKKAGA